MRKPLPAALLAAAILGIPALTAGAAPAAPSGVRVVAVATAPPEIIHLYTHKMCSVLHKTIAPAIGMMMQNDKTIAKSPDLFKEYNFAMGYGSEGSQDMAVMRMENLVGPLADNVVAIHRQLDDTNAFPAVARTEDDRRLLQLKAEMERALASQEGALDIINGFVTTQQLSAMQHEGFGYISAINNPETTKNNTSASNAITGNGGGLFSTPPPNDQDVSATLSNAGLPSNPYEIDLTRLPGLTLGYNPVTHLKDGIEWTQADAQKQEDVLSRDVLDAVKTCTPQTTVIPKGSPTP